MQPKAANQAARQADAREKSGSVASMRRKQFAERVAAPMQKFAPRVPGPKSDSPSQAAHAPSESAAAAVAHEPFRTPRSFHERSLRPSASACRKARPHAFTGNGHRQFRTRRQSARCLRVSLAAEQDSQSPFPRSAVVGSQYTSLAETLGKKRQTHHGAAISDFAKAPRRQTSFAETGVTYNCAFSAQWTSTQSVHGRASKMLPKTQKTHARRFSSIQVPSSRVPANAIRPRQ